jgi:hypothetical protein
MKNFDAFGGAVKDCHLRLIERLIGCGNDLSSSEQLFAG